jgi:hypothetical protein
MSHLHTRTSMFPTPHTGMKGQLHEIFRLTALVLRLTVPVSFVALRERLYGCELRLSCL